jgi:UDP-glucuronate decarboxylase
LEKIGETEIKLEPLEAVRQAISGIAKPAEPTAKRRILLTGAGGFIGSALRGQLSLQFDVIALKRNELDVEAGSTWLSILAAEHSVDTIVHLANPVVYTSNRALGPSLTMLRNVIDVCVTQDITLVYLSSWEVYSGYAGVLHADEALPLLPRGPYGEAKQLAETMIAHRHRIDGLRCALIRSSPVYGPGSSKPKFIFNFLEKAVCSEDIVTHRYLNGDASLDLLYIDDLVSLLTKVCQERYVGTLNIGTGVLTSTPAIAKYLKDALKSRSRIDYVSIKSHAAHIAMNYRRAKTELGWEPKIPLSDGLQLVLKNYIEKAGTS